jgi:uncharacterized membrane protein YuzA (DUF378 family)
MNMRKEPGSSILTKVLAALVIIGALNWGLVGLFKWNLVTAIFGGDVRPAAASGFSQFIYIVVGLAGLAFAFTFPWGKRVTPGVTDRTGRIDTRREVHP